MQLLSYVRCFSFLSLYTFASEIGHIQQEGERTESGGHSNLFGGGTVRECPPLSKALMVLNKQNSCYNFIHWTIFLIFPKQVVTHCRACNHHFTMCNNRTHFEERKVNLFSVRILFFMDTCVQILHIQHNSKQSVHLLLWHILQVCHMVTWPVAQNNKILTL